MKNRIKENNNIIILLLIVQIIKEDYNLLKIYLNYCINYMIIQI